MKITRQNNQVIINWDDTPHNTNQVTVLEEDDFTILSRVIRLFYNNNRKETEINRETYLKKEHEELRSHIVKSSERSINKERFEAMRTNDGSVGEFARKWLGAHDELKREGKI